VKEGERDAWAASTRGTGELIVAAVEAGASELLVTVGGSATTDGGAGAVEVLQEAGVKPKLEVLCDVRSAFEEAPRVFGRRRAPTRARSSGWSGGSTSWRRPHRAIRAA